MNLTKLDFEKITRKDGRKYNQLRNVKITTDVVEYAEGSAMIEFGKTRVLCTASVENKSAPWLIGSGSGWVTAEYGMLPRSTHQRIKREKSMTGGRTQEISRLIGRSLRASVDLKAIYEKQIIIDCDVINADGGTRTAAITGGFVALALALSKMKNKKEISTLPLKSYVAAVSVGLDNGTPLLDLNYDEDSKIHTDMNFVINAKGEYIEIQGTAESEPFSETQLAEMMTIAKQGCFTLIDEQKRVLSGILNL
ncbi:MAG: ribonuclease PH [Bdellovibrionaceae bacterium]|nr:ribonuclease PH [Pseudobdellovibrionaceae bacterium]